MVRKISESGGKNKKMGANPHEKNRSSTEILKKSARAKNKIWRRLGRGGRSARPLKNFALTPLALQKEILQLMFTEVLDFFENRVYNNIERSRRRSEILFIYFSRKEKVYGKH